MRTIRNFGSFGTRLMRLVAVALIALTLSGGMPLISRNLGIVSAAAATQKASADTLHLKLASTVKLQGKTFVGTPAAEVTKLNDMLATAGKTKVKPLQANANKTALQAKISKKLAGYYVVTVKSGDLSKLSTELKGLSIVTEAYAAPVAAPSPTADYTSLQTYLQTSPKGIDSTYAQNVAGGSGANVRVFDIEYSWNTSHEDLSKSRTALLPYGTPSDPFGNNNHGTAVLGELSADSNGYGVTGAVKDANLTLINANSVEYGYDPVAALHLAASKAVPGDVVLIEQQAYGPNNNAFVPVEWVPAIYDAISALTASGVTVVEPAGNGSENLDNATYYGSSFPAGKADSGAIIVGAGAACTDSNRLSRLSFSNYGKRVNAQGPGECVATTGYGALTGTTANGYYTNAFSGTSSASPVVAAAAASLSSASKAYNGVTLTPAQIRSTLQSTGTAQNLSSGMLTGNIGAQPNLAKALATLRPADTTAPTTPTGLTATATVAKKVWTVKLAWNASTDNVGIANYRIYRNGALLTTTTGNTYSDAAVKANMTYKYQVVAVDAAGNISPLSTSATVTTK